MRIAFSSKATSSKGVVAIAALALICIGMSAPVDAQPTGNPKGSRAPSVQGESAKKPATRATPGDSGDKSGSVSSGETVTPDSPKARSGNLRTPGIGTTGGLSGHHPGDPPSTGPTQTDQAPKPKPKQ